MYRLYIDYGNGYQNEKENTIEDIINRLQNKNYDKYLIIERKDNTDNIIDFGTNNEEIKQYKKKR